MNPLSSVRGASSAVLRVAMLAAMLMLAAGTSQADPGNGRGSGRGGRDHGGGGERTFSGGGERSNRGGGGNRNDGGRKYRGGDQHNGGGSGRTYGGGDRQYRGGGGSSYGGGDRVYRGGGGSSYGGGVRVYRGGGGRTYGGGSHVYRGGGGQYYGGSRPYYGGVRYYSGGAYCGPIVRRYARPRSYISLGIGLGLPYYCPPVYRDYVEPYPVVREVVPQIDVENEPPAGCVYYDSFCDRQFSNLDEYTDHIDSTDHAKTIEIVWQDSGDRVRTLEFVGGYWSVQR